ncbi:UvrD-helicase domain-containing protein [Sulfurisoma sediminicola]|uniref:DNA 3'-5' helicase n=1 Tax=Sulfurisoma sediminicola TaxID=1381557 RepID=A0A497XDP0_9PROT|nr:UvrD-helicase domain-containing protein [Sulfurisoma sediminicola]RLJ65083.1 ATP-dependent exoDNAse (exonuclease V) beta subunit [Sulfurisoma sediminicola]
MSEAARVAGDLLAADAAARSRALELGSFIVEAPAGAGKTELLTQRYLRLLSCVEAPEEIVAITFTNKAAGEMASRILESLQRAAAGERPEAAHKRITFDLARAALAAGAERSWNLLEHPARLRITTIDALCMNLARQMPLLSRFGSQPRLAEEASRHYAEAARRTLALIAEDGDAGALADTVAAALRHLDNDAVRLGLLLAEMLARRDQWLRHALAAPSRAEAEDGFAQLIGRELESAAAAIDARRQAALMPAARYAAANLPPESPLAPLLEWTVPLAPGADALPQWRALAALLLTAEGEPRKAWNKNLGLPPGKESDTHKKTLAALAQELAADEAAALARVRELPAPRYTDEEWLTVEALGALLKVAAAQLWTVFAEAGETDFIEVASRALQALGTSDAPTDLALALDYRIRHLLVDEFQDTSPTQVELLERLTAGWTMDEKAGAGRTLFAVGDPMQSIYRFRKADVGLFLRVADFGIGGLPLERLQLARNNRSAPAVVDWINARFADIFPPQDSVFEGAIRYRAFAATRPAAACAGVFVHPLVVAKDMPGDAAEVIEAERILEVIDAARRDDPQGRIAVLVRARSHLDALVATLRRQRPALRFQAVEIEALRSRQTIQDLLSLARALHHRGDRVHWLAILRAPWCGLTLADLHALAGDDHRSTVWQLLGDDARVARLSPDGRRRLLHLRGVVGEALAHQGRQRPRRWLESTWLGLGGGACLREDAAVADARAFLELVDRLDAAGRFSLEELERETARLYAAPDAAAGDTLQFMTVHKAKGLEFETVIVPGLHRAVGGGGGGEQKLMRWEEVAFAGTDERLVAAPIRGKGRGDGASLHDYLRLLERERAANEDQRTLYVAATRAIRALHLVGVACPRNDGTLAAPAASFLELLWPALSAKFDEAPLQEAVADAGAGAQFEPRLLRLVDPAIAELLRAGAEVENLPLPRVPTEAVGDGGGAGGDAALAADVGTLVHGYLEMIARDGLAPWPLSRVESLLPAMRVWLGQQGHAEAAVRRGAREAQNALRATLESVAGRWVLGDHDEAVAEWAVSVADGEAIATQVIDRSFVADGARWIIDYKTTKVGTGTTLRQHAERYREQLERYCALFRADGLPLRMAVFYTATGDLLELLPSGEASGS